MAEKTKFRKILRIILIVLGIWLGVGLIISVIAIAVSGGSAPTINRESNQTEFSPAIQEESKTQVAPIGSTLHAGDFAVTIESAIWKDRVIIGNEFSNIRPEKGVHFLILDMTFKNLGNEPSYLLDGTLYIANPSRTFTLDTSETILQDGWGIFLDKVNPLVSKHTKLVYKISDEIKGTVSWLPYKGNIYFLIGETP